MAVVGNLRACALISQIGALGPLPTLEVIAAYGG